MRNILVRTVDTHFKIAQQFMCSTKFMISTSVNLSIWRWSCPAHLVCIATFKQHWPRHIHIVPWLKFEGQPKQNLKAIEVKKHKKIQTELADYGPRRQFCIDCSIHMPRETLIQTHRAEYTLETLGLNFSAPNDVFLGLYALDSAVSG